MRVGCDHHGIALIGWAEVVEEAPGADLAEAGLRKQALYFYAGPGGQLYGSGRNDLRLEVFHGST